MFIWLKWLFFLFLKYSIHTFLIVAYHAYGPSSHQLRHLGCSRFSATSKPLALIQSGWSHAFYVAVDAVADMSVHLLHTCLYDTCEPALPTTWWLLSAHGAAESTVPNSGLVAVRQNATQIILKESFESWWRVAFQNWFFKI